MAWTLGQGRNQVFADGQVMIEARYPSWPAAGLEMYVADLSPLWPTFGEFSIPEPVKEPGRITSRLLEGQPADYWKGAIYYGVHFQGWCGQTGIIESSQPGEIRVGHRTSGWWFTGPYHGTYKPEEGRGMIVGHMHALDRARPVALARQYAVFHPARNRTGPGGSQTPAIGLRPQRLPAHSPGGPGDRGRLAASGGCGLVRGGPLPAVVYLPLHPPGQHGAGRRGPGHDQVGRNGDLRGRPRQ